MYYDIYLYTLCYYICCLLGACMRCTWLCSLKPGVTAREIGGCMQGGSRGYFAAMAVRRGILASALPINCSEFSEASGTL
jgi:hypothetical protein